MLDQAVNLTTIFSAVIFLATFVFSAYQFKNSTLVARANFWLELEKMFAEHDDVHMRLRPGGEWSEEGTGPTTVEEWAKVEDYMGLFEHCECLLKEKLIDDKTFKSIFSYRLENILNNDLIVEKKLKNEERHRWKHFINLVKKCGL